MCCIKKVTQLHTSYIEVRVRGGGGEIATLKSLIKRAFLISSTQASLEDELIYLKRVFCTNNDYPPRLIDVIIKNEICQHNQQQNINDNNTENIQTSIEKVNI